MLRITLRDAFWLVVVALIVSLWAFGGRIAKRFDSRRAVAISGSPPSTLLGKGGMQSGGESPKSSDVTSASGDARKPVRQFGGPVGPVRQIRLSPNGKLLLSCPGGPSADGIVRLWEVASGKSFQTFSALSSQLAGIGFTPDSDRALSLSMGTIQIWDVATGKELGRQWVGESPSCLDIAPQASIAAIGLSSGDVVIWDYAAGIEKSRLKGHSQAVTAAKFSAAGERLFTAAADHTLRLWNVASGKPIVGKSTPRTEVAAQEMKVAQAESELKAARLAREEYLSGTFVEEEKRALWGTSVAQQNLLTAERGVQAAKRLLDKGVVTSKQVEIAQGTAATARQYLEAWQKELETLRKYTKARVLQQRDNEIEVAEARLLEESDRLASERVESGAECFAKLPGSIGGMSLSSDNKRIAVADGGEVLVFDAQTGDIRQKFDAGAQKVTCLVFAPRGTQLLAAENDHVVSQWDVRTGELVAEHRMPDASISSIVVSSDGRSFFTASADDKASIRMWRLDGREASDTQDVGTDR
jgi:hypothetical protein